MKKRKKFSSTLEQHLNDMARWEETKPEVPSITDEAFSAELVYMPNDKKRMLPEGMYIKFEGRNGGEIAIPVITALGISEWVIGLVGGSVEIPEKFRTAVNKRFDYTSDIDDEDDDEEGPE